MESWRLNNGIEVFRTVCFTMSLIVNLLCPCWLNTDVHAAMGPAVLSHLSFSFQIRSIFSCKGVLPQLCGRIYAHTRDVQRSNLPAWELPRFYVQIKNEMKNKVKNRVTWPIIYQPVGTSHEPRNPGPTVRAMQNIISYIVHWIAHPYNTVQFWVSEFQLHNAVKK